MAHNFLDTPRTELMDRTRFTNPDLSELPSFQAPAGNDDLLKAMRTRKAAALATPQPRQPLASRRNVPARQEFTPLLHSAAKNRLRIRGREDKENGGLVTPAALKPGYRFSSPALPEASMFPDSSQIDSSHTPMVPVDSSSAMSTPMTVLPKAGELGMDGNVLTLKEQEAKLEKIDKENFGLKLKIHFLEENLRRTGPEWNQQISKENVELKANAGMMERELRKQRKTVSDAERELGVYKQQLKDYAEKMKRRHMDEAFKEEMDKLQAVADARQKQLEDLARQLQQAEAAQHNVEQDENLRDQIEDLEAELKQKDIAIDERQEEIDDLQHKLRTADGSTDAELEEKDRQIDDLENKLESLEEQMQKVGVKKQQDLTSLKDQTSQKERDQETLISDLQKQIEVADKDRRELLRNFEARFQSYDREKKSELEAVQRKLEQLSVEKAAEIESLELRIKLSQTQGNNQSSLAQQAAEDAKNQLLKVTREKDEELEGLRSQLDTYEGIQDELEVCQKQLADYADDVNQRHTREVEQERAMSKLRDDVLQKERDLAALQSTTQDLGSATQQVATLKASLAERDREIAALQKAGTASAVTIKELQELRASLDDRDRELGAASEKLEFLQDSVSAHEVTSKERDTLKSQLVAMEQDLQSQEDELADLDDLREKYALREKEISDLSTKLATTETLSSDRDRQIKMLQQTVTDKDAELQVLRETADGPDSQLEGMQSLMRHREEDMRSLRQTINAHEKNVDALQRTANERLALVEELRKTLTETRQELDDEIAVLEGTLDDAEADKDELATKVQQLEEELKVTLESRAGSESVEKELRGVNREKSRLQAQISSLERERESADVERSSLQSTIKQLRADLLAAKNTGLDTDDNAAELEDLRAELTQKETALLEAQMKLRKLNHNSADIEDLQLQLEAKETAHEALTLQHKQSLAQVSKTHEKATNQLRSLLQQTSTDLQALQSKSHTTDRTHKSQLSALKNQLLDTENELVSLQQQQSRQISAQAKMQDSREENGRLQIAVMEKEKQHIREVRGLAKQIQFLIAKLGREKGFREQLGFQKHWFLGLVNAYGECNQSNLRMIEDMGITPSATIRDRRPTIKTVAHVFVFMARIRKAALGWGETKKVQDLLAKEKERMGREREKALKQRTPSRGMR